MYINLKSRKFVFVILTLIFTASLPLFADDNDWDWGENSPNQQQPGTPPNKTPPGYVDPPLGGNNGLSSAGDMTLTIQAGVGIPTLFSIPKVRKNLKVGFVGCISFDYSFTPHFFVGGGLQGYFSHTVMGAGNFETVNNSVTSNDASFSLIPLDVHAGYKFVVGSFEFPLSMGIGGCFNTHNDLFNFGLFLKWSAAVYWRLSAKWGAGIGYEWWMTPQSGKDHETGVHKKVLGNYSNIYANVRFYF